MSAIACPACHDTSHLVPVPGDRAKCRACGEVFDLPKTPQKICSSCGIDVSQQKRTRDGQGHYYCQPCWDAQVAAAAARAVRLAPGQSPPHYLCADCEESFSADGVQNVGGQAVCHACYQKRQALAADNDPLAALAGLAEPEEDLLRCPNCGAMFGIAYMEASGICQRCASNPPRSSASNAAAVKRSRLPRLMSAGVAGALILVVVGIFALRSKVQRQSAAVNNERQRDAAIAWVRTDPDRAFEAYAHVVAEQVQIHSDEIISRMEKTPRTGSLEHGIQLANWSKDKTTILADFRVAVQHPDGVLPLAGDLLLTRRFTFNVGHTDASAINGVKWTKQVNDTVVRLRFVWNGDRWEFRAVQDGDLDVVANVDLQLAMEPVIGTIPNPSVMTVVGPANAANGNSADIPAAVTARPSEHTDNSGKVSAAKPVMTPIATSPPTALPASPWPDIPNFPSLVGYHVTQDQIDLIGAITEAMKPEMDQAVATRSLQRMLAWTQKYLNRVSTEVYDDGQRAAFEPVKKQFLASLARQWKLPLHEELATAPGMGARVPPVVDPSHAGQRFQEFSLGEVDPGIIKGSITISPDGSSAAYIVAREQLFHVVLNGKLSAAYTGVGTPGVIFSPDGQHSAYAANRPHGYAVFLDGREQPTFAGISVESALFSDDGTRFIYAADTGAGWVFVDNGRPTPAYEEIDKNVLSADGKGFAFAAKTGDEWRVVHNGKIEGGYHNIGKKIQISADGSRVAYSAERGGRFFAVIDGHEEGPYDGIAEQPWFSPDGRRVAFAAQRAKKWAVVVDGKTIGRHRAIGNVVFSPDSKQFAYAAGDTQGWRMIVNGTEKKVFPNLLEIAPAFSADSSQLMYAANPGTGAVILVNDQVNGPFEGLESYALSPDGKHIALSVVQGKKHIVILDGKASNPFDQVQGNSLRFSRDGLHLGFVGVHDEKMALVVDGNESRLYDSVLSDVVAPVSVGSMFRIVAYRPASLFRVEAIDQSPVGGHADAPRNATASSAGKLNEAPRVVLICDCSGSMLNKATDMRRLLAKAVNGLPQEHWQFNVIAFSGFKSELRMAGEQLLIPTAENKRKAIEAVEDVTPSGTGNIQAAFDAALKQKPTAIVLWSDGNVDKFAQIGPGLAVQCKKFAVSVNIVQVDPFNDVGEYSADLKALAEATGGKFNRWHE